jgi:hypothetical protein
VTESRDERSARILRELEALGPTSDRGSGCHVCGEYIPGQRYPEQLCSAPCRAEQRKRTRAANKAKKEQS